MIFVTIGIYLLVIYYLFSSGWLAFIGIGIGLYFYIKWRRTIKIQSAVVVSRTRVMKRVYQQSGFSIGSSGHSRLYWSARNVPAGVVVVFEVTYTNGRVRRVRTNEGTGKYRKLMSYTGKPPCPNVNQKYTQREQVRVDSVETPPPEVKKNQLHQGVYVIGKDIPVGTYDLEWVWGNGCVHKFADETTALGASNYFQWIGNEHDYECKHCVGVICRDGEYLRVDGNVVVEIRRSKQVEIDL